MPYSGDGLCYNARRPGVQKISGCRSYDLERRSTPARQRRTCVIAGFIKHRGRPDRKMSNSSDSTARYSHDTNLRYVACPRPKSRAPLYAGLWTAPLTRRDSSFPISMRTTRLLRTRRRLPQAYACLPAGHVRFCLSSVLGRQSRSRFNWGTKYLSTANKTHQYLNCSNLFRPAAQAHCWFLVYPCPCA